MRPVMQLREGLRIRRELLNIVNTKSKPLPEYEVWSAAFCVEHITNISQQLIEVLTKLGQAGQAERVREELTETRKATMREIERLPDTPDKSREQRRNLVWLHTKYAEDFQDAGQLDKAEFEIRKAMALCEVRLPAPARRSSTNARLGRSSYSRILVQQNEYADALESYNEIAPILSEAGVFTQRAEVHEALGNEAAALADLQRAVELAPPSQTFTGHWVTSSRNDIVTGMPLSHTQSSSNGCLKAPRRMRAGAWRILHSGNMTRHWPISAGRWNSIASESPAAIALAWFLATAPPEFRDPVGGTRHRRPPGGTLATTALLL